MEPQLIVDTESLRVCMFCPTMERAFGPVAEGVNALEQMQRFIEILPDDPRVFDAPTLEILWVEFLRQANADDVPPGREEFDAMVVAGKGIIAVDEANRSAQLAVSDTAPEPGPHDSDVDAALAAGQAVMEAAGVGSPPPAGFASGGQPGVIPAMIPIGHRVCWACGGAGHEPDRPGTVCGICDGDGHIPD